MILDAFTFYNELNMLEYRLQELYDHVDWFILVEATHTFRGDPKPLFFTENRERFRRYLDKIIVVVVEDMPMDTDAWGRERHQRNAIRRGVEQVSPSMESILLISDVDEIPDKTILPLLSSDTLYTLEQDMYYYDCTWKYNESCIAAKSVPIHLYLHYDCDAHKIRFDIKNLPRIRYAGWHFSYFGDANFIRTKIESFSHQEYNSETYKNRTHVEDCIQRGADMFSRQYIHLTKVPCSLNPYLPASISLLCKT